MGRGDILRYGILKSRDLVELYFGGRMVANVREANFNVTSATPIRILTQDPARISYELTITAGSGVTDYVASIASNADTAASSSGLLVRSAYPQVVRIKRTFFEDLDSVVQPIFAANPAGGGTQISVREVYLTPAPVDEVPLAG